MEELFELDRTIRNLEKACKGLANKIATVAVNFSKERFRAQNWVDDRTEVWKKRKERGSKRNQRALLVKSGRLRRSIRKISINGDIITIGTDVPYAEAHNTGVREIVNVRAHVRRSYEKVKKGTGVYSTRTRKERTRTVREATGGTTVQSYKRRMNLPRRQFLGQSAVLNQQIERAVTAELIRALR